MAIKRKIKAAISFAVIKIVDNLNIVQRLDKNSIYLYEKFNENIKILLGQLFNVDKWDEYIDKNLDKDFEDFLAIRENSDSLTFLYLIEIIINLKISDY